MLLSFLCDIDSSCATNAGAVANNLLMELHNLDDVVDCEYTEKSAGCDSDLEAMGTIDYYMDAFPGDEMDYYRRRNCTFFRKNDGRRWSL